MRIAPGETNKTLADAPAFSGDGSASRMQIFKGVGVASGIAIGPAYLYERTSHDIQQREIEEGAEETEVQRFRTAVERAERDLKKIISITREKLGDESAGIFEAQVLMLHDVALLEPVIECINHHRCNASFAVKHVMDEHRQRMQASSSEYLRERSNDLLDVQDRIITHLRREKLLSAIDTNAIVVAENLTAADIILFSRRGILGCALDFGGATSHVSIMARALGLPAVMSLHGMAEKIERGDLLILNGFTGEVIVNPDEDMLAFYRGQQVRYQQLLKEQKELVPLPAETLDHHPIILRGNLEVIEELALLDENGATGIGLFRTEMLFLMRGRLDYSEDEQLAVYKRIVEHVAPEVTTFRLLDLGGDKMLPVAHREHNPFLGWRGIRILLDRPEVLLPQLRALLRASAFGPLRILVPMVTNLNEVEQLYALLERVKTELRERGEAFDEHVPVGIMVEVPAVALMAERFAARVDFFSIGTNDLTQYALAVDRGNDLVADRYHELHPGVLALIKQTVEAARKHHIPVSLCGEMAAKPRATPILIGLGVHELSAAPTYLLEVKRVIRAIRLSEAEELAEQALAASDAEVIDEMLKEWLDVHGCGMSHFLNAHEPLVPNPTSETAANEVE